MNNILSKIRLLFLMFFLSGLSVFSQGFLREIPLEQQVQASELVIEGKVIAKSAFWGADDNIYTKNTLEVYKVFKGDAVKTVDVITPGGTIGFDCQIVTHSLKLKVGDLGVFALRGSEVPGLDETLSYKAYSGVQGFYKYNLYNDAAHNPFTSKQGITSSFYKLISSYTKKSYSVVKTFNVAQETSKLNQAKSNLAPTGISFVPTSVSAGTRSIITITPASGSSGDFGATKGKVSFRDADTGGEDDQNNAVYVDALDSQILNWSTTSITVEVPAEAGTGNIRVTDASSNTIESTEDLRVTYALLNVNFSVNNGSGNMIYAYPTRLVNNDGSGGYEFQFETSFNADNVHSGAKADFIAALETWRCETGVNFGVGAVSSVDQVSMTDGVNIVRFDNGNELPDGTVGRTSYSFTLCLNNSDVINDSQVYPTDIDIVFDNETNWHFGAGFPGFEVDFQGVALHEIGHAHQLAHVINDTDDVMHYSTSAGEQIRDLSDDNKTAGHVVEARSEQSVPVASCFSGKSEMAGISNSNCTLSIGSHEIGHDALKLYPNPTKDWLYIQGASTVELEQIFVFDIGGRLILSKSFDQPSQEEILDLSGLTKGVYFVKLSAKSGELTEKVIVD
ncbi:T9SS type A sorting domain-containing protein [Pseudotamlana haliotis]|nr:T9SS type A sorting domain-containing protein [Tamlana haliotis]